jgi:peptide/nickel transport system permease protein
VLTVVFFALHLAPGDPTLILLDPRVPRAHQQQLREVFGLDGSITQQYFAWLRAILIEFNWGVSFSRMEPVKDLVLRYLPNTLLLAVAALLVQFGAGLSFGILAATKPGGVRDSLISIFALTLYSVPVFWLSLVALLFLSHRWGLFPPGHMVSSLAERSSPLVRALDLLHHLFLPSVVLGLSFAGATSRFVRNGLRTAIGQDYIRTAKSIGLSSFRILCLHALRNTLGSLIQIFGLSFPILLSGSLVVEVIFSWPGLGRLTYEAILARDYPLILATTALTTTLVIIGSLLADLAQTSIDPRAETI